MKPVISILLAFVCNSGDLDECACGTGAKSDVGLELLATGVGLTLCTFSVQTICSKHSDC